MKFDIYNRQTWNDTEVVDAETRLANRAVGAMGQKIPELRKLKVKLEEKVCKTNKAYDVATSLEINNPKAFKLMEVKYTYPDQTRMITAINTILNYWSKSDTQLTKQAGWRHMVSYFDVLKPLLTATDHQSKTDRLVEDYSTTKVSGNAAWDAFLTVRVSLDEFMSSAQKRIVRYDDEEPESDNGQDDD